MYFEASTILSSKSYKSPLVESSPSTKEHEANGGYISLDKVDTRSNAPHVRASQAPPLQQPPPSMYNTFNHENDQHLYEHIPGQYEHVESRGVPPGLPPDRNSSRPHHYNHIGLPREKAPAVQAGQYDKLEKEMKPVLQPSKLEKDTTTQPPLPSTPNSDKFNPYVLEPTS